MAKRIAPAIHLGAAWLLVAGLLVQVFLAGLGVFADESSFSTHRDFGHLLEVFPVVLLVTAFVAGYGRRPALAAVALLGLLLLQTILALQRGSSDILAALHPVNGFLVLLAAVLVAWDSTLRWRTPRPGDAEVAPG
jgi:hypothetical protein